MRPSDHLFDFGRPVAYYPGLVKHLGSVNAVLLFCQFFYWSDKTDNDLGVYKSVEEIESETGLSYREQATARKQLISRGVLIETHKRLEHRIYYRIDRDRLDALLSSANCETCNSRTAESAFREETKAQFDLTEITTEITSETLGASAQADDGFELAWKAYPKREGANPKNKAHSAWKARIKDGVTAEVMLAGVARYAAYCQAKGSVGTEYVMQAQRFFGKGREFENPWTTAAPRPSRHTGLSQRDHTKGLIEREDGGYAF